MKTNSLEKALRLSPTKGIEIIILGYSDRVMLTHIIAKPGSIIPIHSHIHDQIGTCVQGEGELISGSQKFKTVPGVSWNILSGELHEWRNTSKGETILIEAFAPPREDYLAKAN